MFDRINVTGIVVADVTEQPPGQQRVQLFGDIFPGTVTQVKIGDAFDEQLMHFLVGAGEFVAGVFHQCFFKAEMRQRVVYGGFDHFTDGLPVSSLLGVEQLIDVIDNAFVLSIDDFDACVKVILPFQVGHIQLLFSYSFADNISTKPDRAIRVVLFSNGFAEFFSIDHSRFGLWTM